MLEEILRRIIREEIRAALLEDSERRELPPGPDYLTISEAAALVSVSPSTIGAWFPREEVGPLRQGQGGAGEARRTAGAHGFGARAAREQVPRGR